MSERVLLFLHLCSPVILQKLFKNALGAKKGTGENKYFQSRS